MAIFGLQPTDIQFLGLLLAAFGALVAPLTVFLIRVGRDIAVIKTTLETHSLNISVHNEESEEDKKLLYKLVSKVEVLESRITDNLIKRMDDMERSIQFLHQVLYGTKAHSAPAYMRGEPDDKLVPEGIFKLTDAEKAVPGLPRCTLCGERFETPARLASHILANHAGAPK